MSTSLNRYQRFNFPQRIEHVILLVSFTLLGLTGLPQKYATAGISEWIIAALGGIEAVRIVHRVSAVVFVLLSVYHFIVIGYKLFVQRKDASMLPGLQDLKDAIQSFGYNLGFVKKAPKMPRYNFAEKAEYWALLWGLVLMGVTGFMLWNPIATVHVLPGVFIPAAKTAHGMEAVLAVLAIILWHFYHVHIKFWNWSMWKGYLTREQMHEEHALELEQMEAARPETPVAPEIIRRRMLIFAPIAAVVALGGTLLVLRFITFEQTAITTLPRRDMEAAFVPQTPTPIPPTATPKPTIEARPMTPGGGAAGQATTWEDGIGALFSEKCGACHGKSGGLGLKSYAEIMRGGKNGVVVISGDAENSPVAIIMRGGKHPGKFSADELETVVNWIQAGAQEK